MTTTLKLYKWFTGHSEYFLQKLVQKRLKQGKEDENRLTERFGIASRTRPKGKLIWLHAASVGEAQSALILIDHLLERAQNAHILVTTGTLTSAALMEKKLPERTFHQYIPIDYPNWAERFLNHWQPDLIFWLESELWPNMLMAVKKRAIPAILVNARLSDKSYARWGLFRRAAQDILSTFRLVFAQTARDQNRFQTLGAGQVIVTDNLKYSAKALPADQKDLDDLAQLLAARKIWLYASTHAGEEELACRLHQILKNTHPDLLTIIVPRHPERGRKIKKLCEDRGLKALLREENHTLPQDDTDIYIADTLGELGLFYRLAPLAVIGRSFSEDGGGGHNPLEAAQLNCAVLHGPNVQFQKDIFEDMHRFNAALRLENEEHALKTLQELLGNENKLPALQKQALTFANQKTGVITKIMDHTEPVLKEIKIV